MFRALALASILAACTPPPEPLNPDLPSKRPEAGSHDDCTAACAHLAELGCEEARPTPAGATCVQVCDNVEQSGATTLDVACVERAPTCEAVDECGYGAK